MNALQSLSSCPITRILVTWPVQLMENWYTLRTEWDGEIIPNPAPALLNPPHPTEVRCAPGGPASATPTSNTPSVEKYKEVPTSDVVERGMDAGRPFRTFLRPLLPWRPCTFLRQTTSCHRGSGPLPFAPDLDLALDLDPEIFKVKGQSRNFFSPKPLQVRSSRCPWKIGFVPLTSPFEFLSRALNRLGAGGPQSCEKLTDILTLAVKSRQFDLFYYWSQDLG